MILESCHYHRMFKQDFYAIFSNEEYINSLFADQVKCKKGNYAYVYFQTYQNTTFIRKLSKLTLDQYLKTFDINTLLFHEMLTISFSIHNFLTPLLDILHNIYLIYDEHVNFPQGSESCKICNNKDNWNEYKKDFDSLLHIQPLKCDWYLKFIDMKLNFINCFNLFFEESKSRIRSNEQTNIFNELLKSFQKYNDPYIFHLFVNNITPSAKSKKIQLADIPTNFIINRIIMLHAGMQISNLFLPHANEESIRYIMNYLKNISIETLMNEIAYVITKFNMDSVFEFLLAILRKIFKENNNFELTWADIINNLYGYVNYKSSLAVIFYNYFKFKNTNNEEIDNATKEIIDIMHLLIDALDLTKEGGKVTTIKMLPPSYSYLPNDIREKIINKILLCENVTEFNVTLVKKILFDLKSNINFYFSLYVEVDNMDEIINLPKILTHIDAQCIKVQQDNKYQLRIFDKVKPTLHGYESYGPGVTAATTKKIMDIIASNISKNNKIDLDKHDVIHTEWMYYYGLLSCITILKNHIIVIPNYFFKFIFNQEITMNDVCDEQYISLLNELNTMEASELDDLMLTMSIPVTIDNKILNYDLIENGNQILVKSDNLTEYITLITNYYTFKIKDTPRYKSIIAFEKGFLKLFDGIKEHHNSEIYYKIFTGLNKHPPLNNQDVLNVLNINNDITKDFVTTYVRSCDTDKLKKFINFTTGFDYLIPGEFISVHTNSTDKNTLPGASTCSKTLQMGSYDSYNKFVNMIDLAINNCVGFQFT